LPEYVRVMDIGIRGLHLAYELLDGVDRLILVDAAQRGQTPGAVSVLRVVASPEAEVLDRPVASPMDAHDMSPDTVLDLVHALGGKLGEVLVVTCEPVDVGAGLGLSDVVQAAIDPAVAAVERLLVEFGDAGDSKEGHHVDENDQSGRAGRRGGSGDPVAAGHQALPGNPRDVT
jgi:hydrogenase maturation protease